MKTKDFSETENLYQQFLNKPPIFKLAIKQFNEKEFLDFFNKLDKVKAESLNYAPIWYAFEEIGWPEGNTYCHQCSTNDMTMGLYHNEHFSELISKRLVLRQKHWKHPKQDLLKAREFLEKFLEDFIIDKN